MLSCFYFLSYRIKPPTLFALQVSNRSPFNPDVDCITRIFLVVPYNVCTTVKLENFLRLCANEDVLRSCLCRLQFLVAFIKNSHSYILLQQNCSPLFPALRNSRHSYIIYAALNLASACTMDVSRKLVWGCLRLNLDIEVNQFKITTFNHKFALYKSAVQKCLYI